MKLKLTKKTVTLTESIVGSVILAIVFGGLLMSFVAARKYVKRANTRLVAVNLGRKTLNGLYTAVRQDQWDTAGEDLYSPDTNWATTDTDNYTIDTIAYGSTSQVRKIAGKDYREARVSITYSID